ncbi:S8 family serine peptidase [Halorussus limi]|uniref:S8 family serine peptidase n=1 Tax=Halorussus limi TaxID=2938695 RepID=A0A8U0HVW1_9EURY|nr:S8 family serine peptidase [Halorussus limi]UPV74851.1 S8 family serine peptidase [Halorussus limi]
MTRHTTSRRELLKYSGAAVGTLAFGSHVAGAARSGPAANRFVVDTKKAGQGAFEGTDLTVTHDLDAIDAAVVRGAEDDVASVTDAYAPDVRISRNEPVERVGPDAHEKDGSEESLYEYQWDKQVQDIREVHEETKGEQTRVAVIDSGVAADHPDLAHAVNEDLSRNFTADDYGAAGPYGGYHGTHVAGIIAAGDNDFGVLGSAPETEVVDCRVFSTGPYAYWGDILAAMLYSAEIGADAANLSLGAYPVSREGYGSFYGKVLNRTTTYIDRQGTLLVMSAGNDSADLQHDTPYCYENDAGETVCFNPISVPNEAASVMSISATGPIGFEWGEDGVEDSPKSPAFYTNYGTNAVNVGAPGGDADLSALGNYGGAAYHDLVLSTIAVPSYGDDGEYEGAEYGYGYAAGTSMAAPQVTGAAALVKSSAADLNANQVQNALEQTASVPDGYDKAYYGHGFVDPLGAVQSR